ncbi:hypothetical protein [Pseudomonas nitroreducens]|uniref:COG3904 family protein n=1 Tax=Pseudomonas nitroreducens TaxID=46680 RepID=UPI002658F8FA|nr:hypothetical protein [Pseudomonas nitroreducens]MCP1647866.1 hypothetical protein [Pseudomonas nitroreducens]MCP1686442.1 hypothetical protein [Pseudomonas nitroreducens]
MLRAALLCSTALFSSLTFAQVEVKPVKHSKVGEVLAVRISEDIAPGDYERLFKGLLANPGKFARKVALLDSIGGSAAESIKMGRLLRESGFETLVPTNSVCQGSCVYLLAAGKHRTVRGYVGLHRPYFPAGDSSQAAGSYNARTYFRDMDIPLELADTMQSIDPQRMRVLTPQELQRYRLGATPAQISAR